MIKSTKLSTKFANTNKKQLLCNVIEEYKVVMEKFVNILWEIDKVPSLLPKEITSQIETNLSSRLVQAAGKQASGIVRGTRKKQEKRKFIYNKLLDKGCYKKARKLFKIIEKTNISKPKLNNIEMELDERFIKQDWNNQTIFDGMITISSIGNKQKIIIPVKRTKHFNKLYLKGQIKKGIRLSAKSITFNFDIPEVQKKEQGNVIGIDVGITNVFTTSNNQFSKTNKHGYDLGKINKILSRKKKGSKAFSKAQQHRKNFINWSINQLNLDNIKTIKIEDIKYLRYKNKFSRFLSHFTYTEIFNKLNDFAYLNGVHIKKVNPTYTSQRCSKCGWVRSKNRKGKQFKCSSCGFAADADLNASFNIVADLRPIGRQERLLHKNRKGFYWNEAKKENIVPSAQKINMDKSP